VDWEDFSGRIIYNVMQEGKHQFLRDLSRNTARGQVTAALAGWLTGRAAPYGYDRMIVDEAGEHRQRVRNGEKYAKPRGWHVTLVPSDDPEKRKWAKWLFTTYANQDVGVRELVNRLNERGIPGPRGGPWHVGTVGDILRNETYAGDFVWPKWTGEGKYNRVVGQTVQPVNGNGKPTMRRNDPAACIRHQGILPALVDRKTFERVQAKMTERRERTSSHKKANKGAYLLSGLVYCGHCGGKMTGMTRKRRKGGREYVYRRYTCSTYFNHGRHVCGYNSVDQGALLRLLLAKLREAVFAGGHREALRERVLARLEARHHAGPGRSGGPARPSGGA